MRLSLKLRAFTLIEILVVISIIVLLLGILSASLIRARDGARRIQCVSNLHQIGLAVGLYSHNHSGRLIIVEPMTPFQTVDETLSIWHSALLPYVAKTIKGKPQDLLKNSAQIWFCPADRDPYPKGFRKYPHPELITSYAPNGYFPPRRNPPPDIPANFRLGPAGGYNLVEIPQPQGCMLMGETSYGPQFYDADALSAAKYNLSRDGHHRSTSGFYHRKSMNILYVDSHVNNIKGEKTEVLVWPKGFEKQHQAGQYMYWPDLTLPDATENPEFWGPGYY